MTECRLTEFSIARGQPLSNTRGVSTRPPLSRLVPWAVVAACAVLIVLLAQRQRDLSRAYTELRRRTATLQAGDVVPTFHATTLAGATVTVGRSAVAEGRQILFIFRTTCPYCVATLPIWKRVADSLRRVTSVSLELFAVSLDSAEPSRAYARAHHLAYPVVLFPERKLVRLYRVAATPQTLVLNAEGRVLYARTGLLDSASVLDSVYRAATAHHSAPALPLVARSPGPRHDYPDVAVHLSKEE